MMNDKMMVLIVFADSSGQIRIGRGSIGSTLQALSILHAKVEISKQPF
jgi:hypothetical protein